jgi:hypothetical protein
MPKENAPFFDICGPVMIGPSSSHAAGAARIAFFDPLSVFFFDSVLLF